MYAKSQFCILEPTVANLTIPVLCMCICMCVEANLHHQAGEMQVC